MRIIIIIMLVLSVPCIEGSSAIFPHMTIEPGIFPVNRDNNAVHTFVVDKITDMTCDAMKTEYFWFLKSQSQATITLPLRLPPLVISASVRIPPLVVSFGYIHPRNSSTISRISCVLCLKTILTTNSSTRLIPSFLQISVEPSSSASNPVLLRNGLSPILYTKEWMTNGIVPLPFLCQLIPQITSLFGTQTVMNIWMLPKSQTVF